MSGDGVHTGAFGGPADHTPVMLNEVLTSLAPAAGQIVIDGTFGAGGYSRAILARGATVIAIDRDPNAIRDGQAMVDEHKGQLSLVHGRFSNLDEIAAGEGHASVDGVVLDIGVSSMQLDQAERGFSFRKDGPLDMRMGQEGVSAADVVNHVSQQDLTRIIGILGEERKASLVSRAIVNSREQEPFWTTGQLSRVVEKAVGRGRNDKIHPATRTFQALRIFVNRELEELASALFAAERLLKAGGRLVVVSFHSLEDRIVKRFFADRSGGQGGSRHQPQVAVEAATFSADGRKAVKASETESLDNPRARSAKLRFAVRTSVAARAADMGIFGLPNLTELETISRGGSRA